MVKGRNVGLALSSGAARGLAHIGVIKVFEEEGIPIHCIAGSSMGALIGALYASGIEIKVIEGLAVSLDKRRWTDWKFSGLGAMGGKKVEDLIKLLLRGKSFQDLIIPLTIVATDLISGEVVKIREGLLVPAVMASISVPGVLPPVQHQGKTLVDGGVLCRVPVEEVRDLGADVVVAVDVGGLIQETQINNFFDVVSQSISIMSSEIMKEKKVKADVLICPDVCDIGLTQFQKAEASIQEGEKAARKALTILRGLL
ncbi:patatin-like phospholipase family protein [Candidatus Contubernalis alkaliaceticus]|uniref:patatin-like phospholipase family protein n=1 Tax=Candidatus Contubernalis alkaliaceticus TaxID=338645 RepID=UPI001F4C3459|nr:patatin-like phospholipase family protein [Candidatus Contubernalis alkalaceticus]UNC92762.1 patatin-like phospholipase family protein [Candidatus Contubernalis alkalaceticus]